MRGYEPVARDVPTWMMTAANRTMSAADQLVVEIQETLPESMLSRFLAARLRQLSDLTKVRYTTAPPGEPMALSEEALVKRVTGDRTKAADLVGEVRAGVVFAARSPALDDRLDLLVAELVSVWLINYEEERRG